MKDKNIKVKDVCKYFGKTQVLDHVNMECRQGEITGIIGRNGAKELFLEEGFDDYIPKPMEQNSLNAILEKFLPEEKIIRSDILEEPALSEDSELSEQSRNSENSDNTEVAGKPHTGGELL